MTPMLNTTTEEQMTNYPASVEVFHAAFGDRFTKVAEVASDRPDDIEAELELAYRLTNSISRDWRENVDFTIGVFELTDYAAHANNGVRSTSTGDYMCVHMSNTEKKWYRVAALGFEEMNDDAIVEHMTYEWNDELGDHERKWTKMPFSALRALGDA